jgi:hypothetical protein
MKPLFLGALFALPLLSQSEPERESIAFILGDATTGMYALASAFHQAQGDRIVTEARSLQAVRDYLERHAPTNQRSWGHVDLILHGNGKGQTDVPLFEGGSMTTTSLLEEKLDRGEFPPLPDLIMDSRSEIRLHGCALGQDETFLKHISKAFGGADAQRPRVSASRFFTCYQQMGMNVQRYYSEAWSLVFPSMDGLLPEFLSARLRERYPECDVDIADAMTRQEARFPGDAYVESKPLSFQWKVVFERVEERPSAAAAHAWLKRQPDLAARLKNRGSSSMI